MKKIVSILTLIALLISSMFLSSCESERYYITEHDMADVSQVQLVYYDNPNSEIIKYHIFAWKKPALKSFDISKMEIIEVLPAEKHEEFVRLMIESMCVIEPPACDSPDGYCVRIVYENGEYIVISASLYKSYCARFNADGSMMEYYGPAPFSNEDLKDFFLHPIPPTLESAQ